MVKVENKKVREEQSRRFQAKVLTEQLKRENVVKIRAKDLLAAARW